MKHILKRREPEEFREWKDLENQEWIPTYDTLSGEVKMSVKKSLMEEQGFICCYCERRLEYSDSHIEHFVPQSLSPEKSLDYDNMLCSCQDHLKSGDPRHCGNLKADWFDADLLVSPLNQDCEESFEFHGDGNIVAKDANRDAEKTIEKLGLNIPKLIALRKSAMIPFLDASLSEDDLISFINDYLQIDADGKFSPFYASIKNILK